MLPSTAKRLFAHYEDVDPTTSVARTFVALRLAEEGDRTDLRWLVERLGEEDLRQILLRHGRRQLSRRSHRFWRRLLDLPPAADERGRRTAGEALWPR